MPILSGVGDVLHPRAVADDVVLVDPVLHVGADNVVPLLLEQKGGDTAVDAAGQGDEEAFRGHTERHYCSGCIVQCSFAISGAEIRPMKIER